MVTTVARQITVRCCTSADVSRRLADWSAYALRGASLALTRHPAWLQVLQRGLGHTPYCIEATREGEVVGLLPLAEVHGPLFGHFLVGLPYVNSGGVMAETEQVADALIAAAVRLADNLEVKYLELRHEAPHEHSALGQRMTTKFHMRLALPEQSDELWTALPAKVRNQVRKAQQHGLEPAWGGVELLADFYAVFSRNMRDLGTPVYGVGLFRAILEQFPERAEICVVRAGPAAYAAALLLHGWGICEAPSASSLREFNFTNANMLLYWSLLQRAMERGQAVFDFGRSTQDSGTFRFKKQWGARPFPASWQYYQRTGNLKSARPDNPGFARLIQVWQRMPVTLTRWIGPAIVRGIP